MNNIVKQLKDMFIQRRTYRKFLSEDVPLEVITDCIEIAVQAPSGANQQPWTFCVVKDAELKQKIRSHSESNEMEFYDNPKLGEWHEDLVDLEVDTSKPFLTDAPYLICVFYHRATPEGKSTYYASKSTGLATGMLISVLHQIGLSSLTYTPQNMDFLNGLLRRPNYEVPYLILVVGKKDKTYKLPRIKRKSKNETIKIYE